MERITSRKNAVIARLRTLGRDGAARRAQGLFVCDGEKLLREALASDAAVDTVLWAGEATVPVPESAAQYSAPPALVEYASPLVNSQGPVFAVRLPETPLPARLERVIVLENVQDPGNVGTVLRTADALGMDAVVLTGACADVYGPKVVRATMGAIFRQPVVCCDRAALRTLLRAHDLPLYGAALTAAARDLRGVSLRRAAVAIGSEGRGLSEALLADCDGQIIIPMRPGAESLNAAVAAAVVMWEIARAEPEK